MLCSSVLHLWHVNCFPTRSKNHHNPRDTALPADRSRLWRHVRSLQCDWLDAGPLDSWGEIQSGSIPCRTIHHHHFIHKRIGVLLWIIYLAGWVELVLHLCRCVHIDAVRHSALHLLLHHGMGSEENAQEERRLLLLVLQWKTLLQWCTTDRETAKVQWNIWRTFHGSGIRKKSKIQQWRQAEPMEGQKLREWGRFRKCLRLVARRRLLWQEEDLGHSWDIRQGRKKSPVCIWRRSIPGQGLWTWTAFKPRQSCHLVYLDCVGSGVCLCCHECEDSFLVHGLDPCWHDGVPVLQNRLELHQARILHDGVCWEWHSGLLVRGCPTANVRL